MQQLASRQALWLRRLATLLFVLTTVVAIVDSVVWFRLERALDLRLTRFADGAAAAGWTLRAHRGQRGGWPFAATLRITGLNLAADRFAWPDRLQWSDDTVLLSLSPWHPDLLRVSLPGTQSLRFGSVSLRGWGSGLALASDGNRITLTADALHLARAGAGPDDVLQSAGLQAELHWRPLQAGGTDLAITLHQVAMPLLGGGGDGRIAERARLVATLEAPLAAARDQPAADQARQPAPSMAAMLARWAGAGGAVQLQEASLDWPDAGIFLSGRLVPVADGAFGGALSLDMSHPERPLSVLRRAGFIGAGQETAMLAVIGLVGDGTGATPSAAAGASGTASGTARRLTLPLSLQDGTISLGRIPLVSLPPL